MLDYIARPLGVFLKFIYDTIAFQNYGLAIIVFTIIVRAAMLPLTLKQYKSTAKMQEIQPLINDVQKRYKDDKEMLNQELMKLYKEHNYNPAGGCLPMIIQMPIILSLYWVIAQPLKFMLGKSEETVIKIVEVAANALGKTVLQMGTQKEMVAMNFFHGHQDALSKVTGLLDKSELIDFNNFLGLHLGEMASYQPDKLFGPDAGIYIPLLILVILATVTTFFSTKISMPKANPDAKQNNPAGCSNNSMMYMGPAMTLIFAFQMPAGVILYWMIGYVVGIVQQLYINKHIKKPNVIPAKAISGDTAKGAANALDSGAVDNTNADEPKNSSGSSQKGSSQKTNGQKGSSQKNKGQKGSGQKGGKKKGGKKK